MKEVKKGKESFWDNFNKVKILRRDFFKLLLGGGVSVVAKDFFQSGEAAGQENTDQQTSEELIQPENVFFDGLDFNAAYLRNPNLISRTTIDALCQRYLPNYEQRFEISKEEVIRRFREWVSVGMLGIDRLLRLGVTDFSKEEVFLKFAPLIMAAKLAKVVYTAQNNPTETDTLFTQHIQQSPYARLAEVMITSLVHKHGKPAERFQRLSESFDPNEYQLEFEYSVGFSEQPNRLPIETKKWWDKVLKGMSFFGSASLDKIILNTRGDIRAPRANRNSERTINLDINGDYAGVIHELLHSQNDLRTFPYIEAGQSTVNEHAMAMVVKLERLIGILQDRSLPIGSLALFLGTIGTRNIEVGQIFEHMSNRLALPNAQPYSTEHHQVHYSSDEITYAIEHFFHLLVGPHQQYDDVSPGVSEIQMPFLGDKAFFSWNQSGPNSPYNNIDYHRVIETARFYKLWTALVSGRLYIPNDNFDMFGSLKRWLDLPNHGDEALYWKGRELDRILNRANRFDERTDYTFDYTQFFTFVFRLSAVGAIREEYSTASLDTKRRYLTNYNTARTLTHELLLIDYLIGQGQTDVVKRLFDEAKGIIGKDQIQHALEEVESFWTDIPSSVEGDPPVELADISVSIPVFEPVWNYYNDIFLTKTHQNITVEELKEKLTKVREFLMTEVE